MSHWACKFGFSVHAMGRADVSHATIQSLGGIRRIQVGKCARVKNLPSRVPLLAHESNRGCIDEWHLEMPQVIAMK